MRLREINGTRLPLKRNPADRIAQGDEIVLFHATNRVELYLFCVGARTNRGQRTSHLLARIADGSPPYLFCNVPLADASTQARATNATSPSAEEDLWLQFGYKIAGNAALVAEGRIVSTDKWHCKSRRVPYNRRKWGKRDSCGIFSTAARAGRR